MGRRSQAYCDTHIRRVAPGIIARKYRMMSGLLRRSRRRRAHFLNTPGEAKQWLTGLLARLEMIWDAIWRQVDKRRVPTKEDVTQVVTEVSQVM